MKNYLLPFISLITILSACSKSDNNTSTTSGKVNSWTFSEGSKTFSGDLVLDAQLNTLLQNNNSYTFSMLGVESGTTNTFSLILSLLDLNFTVKTYQSGTAGNEYLNAFYYGPLNSVDEIYKSSNLDPGPIMNYTITNYDAAKDIVTIEFSGQAQLATGSFVNITKGKVIAKVER